MELWLIIYSALVSIPQKILTAGIYWVWLYAYYLRHREVVPACLPREALRKTGPLPVKGDNEGFLGKSSTRSYREARQMQKAEKNYLGGGTYEQWLKDKTIF